MEITKPTFKRFWSAGLTQKTYSLVYSRSRLTLLIGGSRSSSLVSALKGATTCVPSGNNTINVLTYITHIHREIEREKECDMIENSISDMIKKGKCYSIYIENNHHSYTTVKYVHVSYPTYNDSNTKESRQIVTYRMCLKGIITHFT